MSTKTIILVQEASIMITSINLLLYELSLFNYSAREIASDFTQKFPVCWGSHTRILGKYQALITVSPSTFIIYTHQMR